MRNKRVRALKLLALGLKEYEHIMFKPATYRGKASNPYKNFIRKVRRSMK